MAPSNRKAIATLAIGPHYESLWRSHCEASWHAYAERHGYDVIAVTQPLDTSDRARARSPAWQALLVLSQDWSAKYDRIAWVDSDIVLNYREAPCILDACPEELVGAVEEYDTFGPMLKQVIKERSRKYWQTLAIVPDELKAAHKGEADPYSAYGLPRTFPHHLNCGVLAASPRRHRALFEHIYYGYEDKGSPAWNYHNWPMAFELQDRKVLHLLDPRFNFVLFYFMLLFAPAVHPLLPTLSGGRLAVRAAFKMSWFLHFAGVQFYMPYLGRLEERYEGGDIKFEEIMHTLPSELKALKDAFDRARPEGKA
ncbi:MAG: hypothetical protein JNK11_10160 [Alphaproteobacteria bacterium]|nr:hypothetical protein [Alphaproteobacteria bacterium]